jgi:hypothetical protein
MPFPGEESNMKGETITRDADSVGYRLNDRKFTGSTILDNVYVKPEEAPDYGRPKAQPPIGQAHLTQRESHCGRRNAFGSGDCPAYQIL